jgi:hypothetical protein
MAKRDFELPPTELLMRVIKHVPQSAELYIGIWRARNDDNNLHIHRDHVRGVLLTTPAKLINALLLLAREEVLDFAEMNGTFAITLEVSDES